MNALERQRQYFGEGQKGRTLESYEASEEMRRQLKACRDLNAELLNTLKTLVADVADYPTWQRPCYALDAAEQAIARAEGKQ